MSGLVRQADRALTKTICIAGYVEQADNQALSSLGSLLRFWKEEQHGKVGTCQISTQVDAKRERHAILTLC